MVQTLNNKRPSGSFRSVLRFRSNLILHLLLPSFGAVQITAWRRDGAVGIVTTLWHRRSVVQLPAEATDLFLQNVRLALGPTQPPTQYVTGVLPRRRSRKPKSMLRMNGVNLRSHPISMIFTGKTLPLQVPVSKRFIYKMKGKALRGSESAKTLPLSTPDIHKHNLLTRAHKVIYPSCVDTGFVTRFLLPFTHWGMER
jgi:hypothetical protein